MRTTTIGCNANASMYWKMIKNLDPDLKLDLISRLSDSLKKRKKVIDKNLADRFYGAWEDNKSAEEMAENIRASRITGTRKLSFFE